ncbi:MAG: hypothetical protein K6G11_07020, partial [Lachnospiraceae bacterium]|nr:hypothetical protein [Lachnospiraceae bacterium]
MCSTIELSRKTDEPLRGSYLWKNATHSSVTFRKVQEFFEFSFHTSKSVGMLRILLLHFVKCRNSSNSPFTLQ